MVLRMDSAFPVDPPSEPLTTLAQRPGARIFCAGSRRWSVYEDLRCYVGKSLIFESDRIARRVRNYSANWRNLTDEQLAESACRADCDAGERRRAEYVGVMKRRGLALIAFMAACHAWQLQPGTPGSAIQSMVADPNGIVRLTLRSGATAELYEPRLGPERRSPAPATKLCHAR